MDECCLIFDLICARPVEKRDTYTECFLNRDESSSITFRIEYNHGYQHAAPEKQVRVVNRCASAGN
jgi:hypothetical protein